MSLDPLNDLIASASPVRDEAVLAAGPAIAELARAVALNEERRARPHPARRRLGRRWLALAAAALVLVPTAAAVGELSARTGWFGNAAHTEDDGSEWLRTDAADFGAVAAGLVPDVPLPRGARWAIETERQVAQGRAHPGLMQETGVRWAYEAYARCAWLASWLRSRENGETRPRRAERLPCSSAQRPGRLRPRRTEAASWRASESLRTRLGNCDESVVRRELAVSCDGVDLGGARWTPGSTASRRSRSAHRAEAPGLHRPPRRPAGQRSGCPRRGVRRGLAPLLPRVGRRRRCAALAVRRGAPRARQPAARRAQAPRAGGAASGGPGVRRTAARAGARPRRQSGPGSASHRRPRAAHARGVGGPHAR